MKKFKYTKWGQTLEILRICAVNSVIFSFLYICFFNLWATKVGGYMFTVIAVATYCFSIYGAGEVAYKNDKKPYVPSDPDIKKCFYLPLLTVGFNIIFAVIYKLSWVFGSDGQGINETWSFITNIFSVAWFAPLGSLGGLEKGNFAIAGIVIMVASPIVFYYLGYIAAMKNFDINEKLFGFMYEKRAQKDKQGKK